MVYKFLILLIFTRTIYASACCGGGGSSSFLITSDNRAKADVIYSNKAFIYDVNSKGIAKKRENGLEEVQENIKLSYSLALDNYVQYSVSINTNTTTKRSQDFEESATELADTMLGMGYEFLPEKFYSVWKPRGFIYLSHTIPIGNSRYDSQSLSGVDISNSGLHKSSFGLLFYKVVQNFDFRVSGEFSKSYPRQFSKLKVAKKNSYRYSFNLGYSPILIPGLRTAIGVESIHEGRFLTNVKSEDSRYSSTSFSLSYLLSEKKSLYLIYADETLLGEASNIGLGRTLSASYSYMWPL